MFYVKKYSTILSRNFKESKTNLLSVFGKSLSSFDMININFCSLLYESYLLHVFRQSISNIIRFGLYSGQSSKKWHSSSISVLHKLQNLFSLSIIGFMCLPFSIHNEWFESLKRENAILSILSWQEKLCGFSLMECWTKNIWLM